MEKYLNLVAGIDGTWNDYSSDTNVLQLIESVCADTYYKLKDGEAIYLSKVNHERGVGTSPTTHYFDGAFAEGLYEPIGHTYDWLAKKLLDKEVGWLPRIYLFGFSRGAYCAHVLSWLLQEVGVPTLPDYAKQIAELYVRKDKDDLRKVVRCAKCVSSPRVKMMGLWDVVTAPLDIRQEYHDGIKSPLVDTVYHAMAADETRIMFPVMQYSDPKNQNVHQVWFSGVHGDVGGMQGYEKYLSEITLNWMGCQAYAEGIGFAQQPIPMAEFDFGGIRKQNSNDEKSNRTYQGGEGVHASLIGRMRYDELYQPNVNALPDKFAVS